MNPIICRTLGELVEVARTNPKQLVIFNPYDEEMSKLSKTIPSKDKIIPNPTEGKQILFFKMLRGK